MPMTGSIAGRLEPWVKPCFSHYKTVETVATPFGLKRDDRAHVFYHKVERNTAGGQSFERMEHKVNVHCMRVYEPDASGKRRSD